MGAESPCVAIVGAGLGGLCLARGLAERGIRFSVFERDAAADSRTQGYRIRIDHHGQQALASCLPAAAYRQFLRTCALPADGVNLLGTGLEDMSDRWVQAWRRGPSDAVDADRSAHRKTMREVLMAGIEPHIHFGKSFSHYVEQDSHIIVHFEDGTTFEADVLVGADGVHSAVRYQRMPAHAPADTGSVCIYGKTYPGDIASADALAPLLGRTSVVFAKGMAVIVDDMRFEQHAFDALDGSAGLTPVDDYVYWAIIGTREAFVLTPAAAVPSQQDVLKSLVVHTARSWATPLRTLFSASATASVTMAPVRRTASMPTWTPGRVTLLGDAIHPMSPAGGLGANTALRDASVLAHCLSRALGDRSMASVGVANYEASMRAYGAQALEASENSAQVLLGLADPLPT